MSLYKIRIFKDIGTVTYYYCIYNGIWSVFGA